MIEILTVVGIVTALVKNIIDIVKSLKTKQKKTPSSSKVRCQKQKNRKK